MQSTVVCRAQAGARSTARAGSVPKPAAKILPKVGGLAAGLLSGAGVARADELALPDLPSLPEVNLPDAAAVADAASDIGSLFADNPLLVGGGLALLLVPVGINVILNLGGSGQKINTTTAARALEALGENPKVILVDIRSKAEVKEQGTPDLKSVKRKAVTLPYTSVVKGEEVVDEAFGAKFAKLGGLDAESRVILIDATGAQVAAAAKQILAAGVVDKVYVVEGGAVGAKGWKEGGLPWKEPGKGLELPFLDLKGLGSLNLAATIDTLTEDFQSAPTLAKAGLAAAGIAGAGFLLINEINLVLEVVGLLAAGQFALKLLFAEEREQTLTEIRTLVNDKIAVTEAGEDLKKLATVLLEEPAGEGKPAAAEAPKPAAAAAEAPKPAAAEAPKPAPAAEPAPAAAVATAPAEGNGAAAPGEAVSENVKEAREWIENWKSKSP